MKTAQQKSLSTTTKLFGKCAAFVFAMLLVSLPQTVCGQYAQQERPERNWQTDNQAPYQNQENSKPVSRWKMFQEQLRDKLGFNRPPNRMQTNMQQNRPTLIQSLFPSQTKQYPNQQPAGRFANSSSPYADLDAPSNFSQSTTHPMNQQRRNENHGVRQVQYQQGVTEYEQLPNPARSNEDVLPYQGTPESVGQSRAIGQSPQQNPLRTQMDPRTNINHAAPRHRGRRPQQPQVIVDGRSFISPRLDSVPNSSAAWHGPVGPSNSNYAQQNSNLPQSSQGFETIYPKESMTPNYPNQQPYPYEDSTPKPPSGFVALENQVTASERALRLQDELFELKQKYQILANENARLRDSVKDKDTVIQGIRKSIDDATYQLQRAQSANQQLQLQVESITAEKIRIQKETENMLKAIESDLDGVLARELSGK